MKIQEIERKTGLERASIRFYEKEGLLIPKRLENGYRDYGEQDVELLKKIKLLRRLGMSIDKIRALQQGSADLSAVISQQASLHSSQIDDHKRCRAVCEAIRSDGAAFASLDADHYLHLLQEIRIDEKKLGPTNFQERIPKEIHPWKRYLARWLDYLLWGAIVQFIWIVILRIRPILGDFGSILLNICSCALFVPVEAVLLHTFGTTPGKYIMGIRLEYLQGGNLPYSDAFYRSFRVFTGGVGLGIPVVSLVMYVIRYCQLTGRSWWPFARRNEINPPEDMAWDEDTEFVYSNYSWKRGVAAAAALVLFAGLAAVATADLIKPRHRGSELTVAQIADNYNATLALIQQDISDFDKLGEDGTKSPVSPNTVIIDMNNSDGNNLMQFTYEQENGFVRSVQIHHTWDSVFWLQPLEGEPVTMALSLLLAQNDCGITELEELTSLIQSQLNQKHVSFAYRNLLIQWDIESDKDMIQGTIYGDSEENVVVTLDFIITIQS